MSAPAAATMIAPAGTVPRPQRGTLPGFRLALWFTLIPLVLIVLVPLAGLAIKTASLGPRELVAAVFNSRALAAYKLTFGASAIAGLVNIVFGLILAWVLARYRFPGRALIDALIDLPFALPTAVAGIALTALYSENGWLGRHLEPMGIKVAFAPSGVTIALVFVGLPFVVRTVEPVLRELDLHMEEVAATLGASRFYTLRKVILPALLPPAVTGFALAFARALGEYGSIVFISGNMPGKTEIVPLLIVTKLEQYDYAGATAIALVMLLTSFGLLLAINRLQRSVRS